MKTMGSQIESVFEAHQLLVSMVDYKGDWPPDQAERLASATTVLLSKTFGVAAQGLTGAELVKKLRARGVHAEICDPASSILGLLDELRFAPGLHEDIGERVGAEAALLLAGFDEHADPAAPPELVEPARAFDDHIPGFDDHTPELDEFRKKPGSSYVLVFGSGPPKRGRFQAMFDNTTRVPVIDLGKNCVCCNKRASTHRRLRGDAYGDYYGGHIYKAPVCDDCYHHAVASAFASSMACMFAGIGAVLMLLGIFIGWGFVVTGLVMTGLPLLFFWGRSQMVKHEIKRGHYSGLEFNISDGYVTVYTHNPKLAAEMIERYADIVTKPEWKKPHSRKAI
jgi:hypothetical protein